MRPTFAPAAKRQFRGICAGSGTREGHFRGRIWAFPPRFLPLRRVTSKGLTCSPAESYLESGQGQSAVKSLIFPIRMPHFGVFWGLEGAFLSPFSARGSRIVPEIAPREQKRSVCGDPMPHFLPLRGWDQARRLVTILSHGAPSSTMEMCSMCNNASYREARCAAMQS